MNIPVATVFLAVAFAAHPGTAGAVSPLLERVTSPPALTPLRFSVHARALKTHSVESDGFGSVDYATQWPGSYFEAAFKGTEVFFRVGASHEILHIAIDDQPALVLPDPSPGIYRVAGLSPSKHTVSVFIATESQAAPNHFGGFGVPEGETGLVAGDRARQIEFIGDSHTVGYGNASAKRDCTPAEVYATTDNTQSLAASMADHWHADYEVNAISGRGVVRNYGGFAGDTLPLAYPYLLFDKKQAVDDPLWRPRLIVAALGNNDFSTPLHKGERWKTSAELASDFEATYVTFLQGLLAKNPNAYVLLWATDGTGGEVAAEEQRVVERMKSFGNRRIDFIAVKSLTFGGCDYHPSATDDMTISDSLTQFVDAHPEIWAEK